MSFYRDGVAVERDIVPSPIRERVEAIQPLFFGSRFLYREGVSDRRGWDIIRKILGI